MEQELDLNIVLDAINPADLSYQEWINVGMGLKQAGYDVEVWDEWSHADGRYHAGECEKKWRSFQGSTSPITAGTIVQMAKERGWKPEHKSYELDWADEIGGGQEVERGISWHPAQELITYLQTLFESSDNVGYVTGVWRNNDGKYLPNKGSYDRTAGQLIDLLSKCHDDIGSVIGDYTPEAGAWIRFNPLDGNGVKNDNVTEYRYALVESDTLPIEQQEVLIRELQLPVACLVHSGGKSVHAIVHVDAGSYKEYRERVQYLYNICKKHGLEIDQQNKNPSRLSRMPGVTRNGIQQRLLASNIGKTDWTEWKDWIESVDDDLPDTESMAAVWDDLPELAPPLIEGVLRQGHKMLLAGPSKAAKSFSLIEMCICIAEGKRWFGSFNCTRGKVLYVNLELDRASCLHRFKDVYEAMDIVPEHLKNIDIWNLRGKSVPMDRLAPKLIRRASNRSYIAIVIDPIYKVITGDENSADQMAAFCNQFDKVCTELGCAVIYCHHHSKGAQGGKRSMDRASGSGVFARDPDALLDLIELDVTDDLRKQITGNAIGKLCGEWLAKYDMLDDVSQDDLCSEKAMNAAKELLSETVYRKLENAAESTRKAAAAQTAWRIEGTLREFPKFQPVNIWFDYPVHRQDTTGVLTDIHPEADTTNWKKNFTKKKPPDAAKKERRQAVETAFEACGIGDDVTVSDLAEYMGATEKTVRNRLKEHGGFAINTGVVTKK